MEWMRDRQTGTKPSISLELPLSVFAIQRNKTHNALQYSSVGVSTYMEDAKTVSVQLGGFCVPSWSQCAPAVTPE